MNRRDFLKKSIFATAGIVVGGSAISSLAGLSGCSTAPAQKRIGLQLYSLREAMKEDPAGTLELVAKMGYKELETASYKEGLIYGYAPAEFRKIVEDLGMKVSSAHTKPADPLTAENAEEMYAWWDKNLDDHAAAGCKYVIQPSMPIGPTLEDVKRYCDYYNRIGEMAKSRNIRTGFHNHAKEFLPIDGEIMYDYMLNNTDADKVVFELDVYWANKAGVSPVEYLNKYAGRFPVLHIKDEDIIGDSGELDFKSIFEAAYAQGMTDYYVEVERYTLPPVNCVEKSYDFLYGADYVK